MSNGRPLSIVPAPATTSSRKLKTLTVAFELARSFVTAGDHSHIYSLCKDAVPADAILVNARYAWPHSIELLIFSEGFDEIAEGNVIPSLNLVATRPSSPDSASLPAAQ